MGQEFDSYWPRIAAGDGGRLVVTWAEEFGPQVDRMYSATLDPGADGFQKPLPIDVAIGEATATYPSLAMNRGGAAYLVYRLVQEEAGLPPGYVRSDTRIARYRAPLWTVLGSLADRNPAQPVATPRPRTRPRSAWTSRATRSWRGRSPTTNSSTGSGRAGCSARRWASRCW